MLELSILPLAALLYAHIEGTERKGEGERISWYLCILTETFNFDKYYYQKRIFFENYQE